MCPDLNVSAFFKGVTMATNFKEFFTQEGKMKSCKNQDDLEKLHFGLKEK